MRRKKGALEPASRCLLTCRCPRQKLAAERKTKQDEDMRVRREELEKKLSELRGGLAQAAQAAPEPKNKVVETSAQEQLAEKHPNYKVHLASCAVNDA